MRPEVGAVGACARGLHAMNRLEACQSMVSWYCSVHFVLCFEDLPVSSTTTGCSRSESPAHSEDPSLPAQRTTTIKRCFKA